jgi:hypothetical protein
MLYVVPNYEFLSINEKGECFSSLTLAKVKPYVDKDGYFRVKVWDGEKLRGCYVHRAIASVFIENTDPLKTQVNHKDSNRQNNTIDNLEWVTPKENHTHGVLFGAIKNTGEESSVSVYTDDKIHEVCRLLQEGKLSQIAISQTVGVNKTLVNGIKSGTSWLHISKDYVIPKPSQRLTDDIVVQVCEMFQSGASYKDILTNISHPRLNRHTLRHIKNRNTFKHIVYKYDWINAQRLSCRVK